MYVIVDSLCKFLTDKFLLKLKGRKAHWLILGA